MVLTTHVACELNENEITTYFTDANIGQLCNSYSICFVHSQIKHKIFTEKLLHGKLPDVITANIIIQLMSSICYRFNKFHVTVF